jgi:hypothetical protein
MILGVDDTDPKETRIIPRLPSSWKGYQAEQWPIWTKNGLVSADISFLREEDGYTFSLTLSSGEPIDCIKVRLPEGKGGQGWHVFRQASRIEIRT